MSTLSHLKLTTKTSIVTILLIVLTATAIGIVSTIVIKSEIESQVVERQAASLRVAATVFEDTVPDIKVERDANNEIVKLQIDGIPSFNDHLMIDKVGMLTGETATVFVWDDKEQDFIRRTTNIIKPDGKRAVGTPLGKKGAVYPVMMRGETFEGEAVILGQEYYTIYQPIFSPNNDVIGILYAGVLKANLNVILSKVQFGVGIASIVAVAISILIAFAVFRTMLRALPNLSGLMERLAANDTSIVVPYQDAHDEIGHMARSVQVFKEKMVESDRLTEEHQAEEAAKTERAATLGGLIADFEGEASALLQGVSNASDDMRSVADGVVENAQQSNDRAGAVSRAAGEASANVGTVAAAAEELSASIGEISRQVKQSSQISAKAVHDAEQTNAQVQGLSDAANKIGDVVSLISDIAEQTNLLALNATIEAARAGDAGKGFAVVASEVKNLANQTAKATEEISQQIGSVQTATNEAVAAIAGITGTISEISDISSAISVAVEEQGSATQEIARNVERAASGTQEVSSNIAGVTDAAENTQQSAARIIQSSETMAREFDSLRGRIQQFLDGVRTG